MKDTYISQRAIIDIPIPTKSERKYYTYNHDDIYEQGYQDALDKAATLPPADVEKVCHCKDCIHNNDCDIQHSAQAGENFFCGFGETEKDVREGVYE